MIVPGTEAALAQIPGSGLFWWFDKLLKLYECMPAKPGRRQARAQMAKWIVERQEADGSWGGIQPPWVYSLIALNLEGMSPDDPVMRKGLEGMRRFSLDDASGWRFQACMSPVWDTAWVVRALHIAGFPPQHPAMDRAVGWLLREQISRGGDWEVRCRGEACGGWAFEFDNDLYPDVDDTAVVVLALLEGGESSRVADAVERAVRWVRAMRSSNRAWAAFDRDNTRQIAYSIPFADFGAMIDPPTEDVTAHVLEMLGALGFDESDPDVAGGLAYLRRTQTPGRFLVRTLGRQPRLRDMVRVGFAQGAAPRRRHGGARGAVVALHAERGRRLGRDASLVRGRFVRRRGRQHALADRMGVARAALGRFWRACRLQARRRVSPRAPGRRNLARAEPHRNRVSRATSTSTTTSTGMSSPPWPSRWTKRAQAPRRLPRTGASRPQR